MPTIEIRGAGSTKRMDVPASTLLATALNIGNHRLDMPCGGAGICLRCRVRACGALSVPTTAERAQLSETALANGVRLACQAKVMGDVRVEIVQSEQIDQIVTSYAREAPAISPYYAKAGVAIDIGTTTIAATLFAANDVPGGPKDTFAMKNPQTRFGADVITRIQMALDGQSAALADAVRSGVEQLAETLLCKRNLALEELDAMILTGNTAMLYMLTGTYPAALARAPFVADRLFGEELPATGLFSRAASGVKIYLPRCISAFVGADITTALIGTDLCSGKDTALLIDIGTNGEIALWHEGRLRCCSTAAGPAFEGVGIACGAYAVAGAIDRVWMEDGRLRYSTINDAKACGICGSGIVDVVALMLYAGVVDEGGALQAVGHALEDRIETTNGQKVFRVAPNVVITAGDIRKVQLAKGSIRAGIETLLASASISADNVARFCIAGGFGNYIDIGNAIAIGLFPQALGEKVQIVGNAALGGAGSLMQNKCIFKAAEHLAESAITVDLSANSVFQQQYIEHMAFE